MKATKKKAQTAPQKEQIEKPVIKFREVTTEELKRLRIDAYPYLV